MHGGNIYKNKVKYDFSANLNPQGLPSGVKKTLSERYEDFEHYPDPECTELKKSLADKLGEVYSTELEDMQIVIGNGASEILYAFFNSVARQKKKAKAMLVSPCFTEYAEALRAAGIETFYFSRSLCHNLRFEELSKAIKETVPDILVITNPNNPDGFLFERSMIIKIAELCLKAGILLLLDECFIELTEKPEESSFVPFLSDFPQTVILRAFTKTFALAGLRLGYAICSGEIAQKIKEQLPPWNVSVPSQKAGKASLQEKNYLKLSRQLIKGERDFLVNQLEDCGLETFASKANFILFYSAAEDLKDKLLEKGILIRECSDYEGLKKGFYRIAVRRHCENIALIEALRKIAIDEAGNEQN